MTLESTQGGANSFYNFDLSDDGTYLVGLWPRSQNNTGAYIEMLNLTDLRTGNASVAQQSSGYRISVLSILSTFK